MRSKIKKSIKADSIPDASKLFGKKSKRLQILPGYSSIYNPSSPILISGKPKILIIEIKSFKNVCNANDLMQVGLSN